MSYYIGIDSGSTAAKVVLLEDGEVKAAVMSPTGASSTKSIARTVEMALECEGIRMDDISCSVSTGYGRHSVDWVHKQITEITCHAKGVHHVVPDAQAIIDIGGQDFKIIRLDTGGSVAEFLMNDKCAAGTGRFMEVMSGILEMDIGEFSKVSLNAKNPVKITSVCTVFAESEVVNHVAKGTDTADLVYGVLDAVATRVYSLARKIVKSVEHVAFTGGVAQNSGLVHILEEKVGHSLLVPEHPQFTGALGAALYARDIHAKETAA